VNGCGEREPITGVWEQTSRTWSRRGLIDWAWFYVCANTR